ncbi:hypothetical protein AC1031_014104 [Aphanomyces cochlioides]|nr:hypothetical protein AC1031_014104 [Aphanomyces cochlioides]
MAITTNERTWEQWCQRVGLLKPSAFCAKCGGAMMLAEKLNIPTRWRCTKAACKGYELSIRLCSFFAKSRVLLCKSVRLLWDWASEKPVLNTKAKKKVGGVGSIVKIDETSMMKKSNTTVANATKTIGCLAASTAPQGSGLPAWCTKIVRNKPCRA